MEEATGNSKTGRPTQAEERSNKQQSGTTEEGKEIGRRTPRKEVPPGFQIVGVSVAACC
jgi:hypothetical protein